MMRARSREMVDGKWRDELSASEERRKSWCMIKKKKKEEEEGIDKRADCTLWLNKTQGLHGLLS